MVSNSMQTQLERVKNSHIRYMGTSMYPTFREPEILCMTPYGSAPPRTGDVIVFIPSGSSARIIHRIAGTSARGYLTRGDNHGGMDTAPVQRAEILGRITGVIRNGRICRVSGGCAGRLHALRVRVMRRLGRRRTVP